MSFNVLTMKVSTSKFFRLGDSRSKKANLLSLGWGYRKPLRFHYNLRQVLPQSHQNRSSQTKDGTRRARSGHAE